MKIFNSKEGFLISGVIIEEKRFSERADKAP